MIHPHKKEETHLHFVGIGGIGMSGIAKVFLNQGYPVTGSDQVETDTTKQLTQLGAKIFIGHNASHVKNAHVVIVSSAIKSNNPEVSEAKKLRIPVIRRAEMLAELMRGKTGIAIAGSHGKTTTTSMLATVLTHAGLDPTLVIGGKVDSFGGNAKLGQGQYVVAEADESDGSFLHLPATYGIITNIDNDHLDHFGSLSAIEDAFIEFVSHFPFYGLVAVCAEDVGVRRTLERMAKPITTYGLSPAYDYYATEITLKSMASRFLVHSQNAKNPIGSIELNVPGKHNILNALAIIAIADRLEISFSKIHAALLSFNGVKRRFEIRLQNEKNTIIDDYAHHPTEIAATLETARNFWTKSIITVFQPHRYTRTHICYDGFLSAFINTDVLIISDIYSAGEDPIEGINSEQLVKSIKRVASVNQKIIYGGDLENTRLKLLEELKTGDLVLCLGAGSVTQLTERLLKYV
ncbi:MAG: UDP-N-acetylmuramate--L-alanine ligase [Bdellovibrio sp.]|nr:UDP-N-acetylmuramate--L-alanine ligase [Bdellovibrio sp.]